MNVFGCSNCAWGTLCSPCYSCYDSRSSQWHISHMQQIIGLIVDNMKGCSCICSGTNQYSMFLVSLLPSLWSLFVCWITRFVDSILDISCLFLTCSVSIVSRSPGPSACFLPYFLYICSFNKWLLLLSIGSLCIYYMCIYCYCLLFLFFTSGLPSAAVPLLLCTVLHM